MKIKEFIELAIDKYCSFIIYDETTNKRKIFVNSDEAISEFGYFPVKGWKIEKEYGINTRMLIKTRTEF